MHVLYKMEDVYLVVSWELLFLIIDEFTESSCLKFIAISIIINL